MLAHVLAVAKAAGKPVGILSTVEADIRRYLDLGMTVVAVGLDVVLLRNASRELRERFAPSPRLPGVLHSRSGRPRPATDSDPSFTEVLERRARARGHSGL